MEDVIQTYQLPYDPKVPVVCFDEASQQLFGEVRPPMRPSRGRPRRVDYEYERKGGVQPVHDVRAAAGLAGCAGDAPANSAGLRQDRARVGRGPLPHAVKIRLVQDNLNTHDGASLYEAFEPGVAWRLLDRIEFHYTPKHGSWLNMAETEISILKSQCLDRRLDTQEQLAGEVAAWVAKRNAQKAKIHWTFTLANARRKLHKVYPSIEG